jgi:hypothetical protein
MVFTREQKKEAYKKLSPEVQDFVMSEETTGMIDGILGEVGLSEEQSIDADGDIFSSLLGLQTLSEAISNIAELSGKSVNELSELKEKLEEEIFIKITELENSEQKTKKEMPQNTNGVGESFEQIILNQARAMQPARQPGEAPQNLPTNSNANEDTKEVIHNYIKNEDPYREPIE